MSNKSASEQDIFRMALGPGKECPPIEELERFASQGVASSTRLESHIKSCPYCQTELQMLQTFQSGETGPASKEIQNVTELLQARSKTILRQPAQPRRPWWKIAFAMPRLVQASVALAAVLLVAGAVIEFRSTSFRPTLNESNQTGPEVLRSGSIVVVSPSGDLKAAPSEIRWEKIPQAARYQVRMLEVDHNEIWKAETAEDHIDLPSAVRSRIVPAKTLFFEITAFDSSGSKVGETGTVRFRLLPGIEKHQ